MARILVVEDDRNANRLLCAVLRKDGHEALSNPGRAYTRMQLLDEIWGWDTESAEATVNVHVNRLRSRFAGCDDFEIRTVRGIGYCAETGGYGK